MREIPTQQPLEHRGYKIYQSNYRLVGIDSRERAVSVSGFTIGSDPGLELKYLGSVFLALGIFLMFYMKAYFFKPRGKTIAPSPTPAG